MNRKITIRTGRGEICYFIIDPQQKLEDQLARLHG